MDSPDFLSIKEFAILLRVHANTIRRGIKSGRIHAIRLGNGSHSVYRIPRTEINRMAFDDLEKVINLLIDKKMIAD